jgi:signal transduction histidine kinase
MAALGTLVSGVAHELRSPLTVAQNHLELARRDVASGRPNVGEHLEGVQGGIDRVARVVDELRRFSRLEVGKRTREEIGPAVQEAVRLFEMVGDRKVTIETDVGATPVVELDRTQLQQVVLNLLDNASAASAAGGVVRVGVTAEGGSAVLRVRDQGVGMPEEVRRRVFEPFFTTKSDGTGLGLAIVRRIVEGHGGTVSCESAVGEGTLFEVRLPAAGARLVPVTDEAAETRYPPVTPRTT